MSERKFPSLSVSGLAIHTVDKFPSNLGCRDDKRRDVAYVLWDSEGETETITEDYEEACAWAELLAAAPRLLEALEGTMRTLRMLHGIDCKCSECRNARAAIASARKVAL